MHSCLPNTGAPADLVLAIIGLSCVALGIVLMVLGHRASRAGVAVLGIAVLAVATGGTVLPAKPASASSCMPAATHSHHVSAPTRPVDQPTSTPPPSGPVCPAGGDISVLPPEDELVWVPVVVPDPRTRPGNPGDFVTVWTNNVSGYTWHVVRGTAGPTSSNCPGDPNDNGTCVDWPAETGWTTYRWDEHNADWEPAGSSGGGSLCGGGSGGNN